MPARSCHDTAITSSSRSLDCWLLLQPDSISDITTCRYILRWDSMGSLQPAGVRGWLLMVSVSLRDASSQGHKEVEIGPAMGSQHGNNNTALWVLQFRGHVWCVAAMQAPHAPPGRMQRVRAQHSITVLQSIVLSAYQVLTQKERVWSPAARDKTAGAYKRQYHPIWKNFLRLSQRLIIAAPG